MLKDLFLNTISANYLLDVMAGKKRCFMRFFCSATNFNSIKTNWIRFTSLIATDIVTIKSRKQKI